MREWSRAHKDIVNQANREWGAKSKDIVNEMKALDALSKGRLGRMRARALRHYRDRLDTLLEDEANRALFVYCARTA